ncbi:MAG: IS21 family transposase, partial [Gammaproteobacteria bacterium]
MPRKTLTMHYVKELLRLKYVGGLSHSQIAAALSISKAVVAKYVALMHAAGLRPEEIPAMSQEALWTRLKPPSPPRGDRVMPDYAHVHTELKRKGVTLQLLWQEYAAAHVGQRVYRYTQFSERYHLYVQSLKRSMRQVHHGGEKLFVDYAGPTIAYGNAGERAQIFVAVLGASNYTFACATARQTLADWVDGLSAALEFIGGVPALIVPDNPRALIADPNRYEPRASATLLDFAQHYGTVILPARPHLPRDKAKVEVGVQIVERWIMARLRNERFHALLPLNTAIAELLVELNTRPFQRLPGSRHSAFEQLDRPALKPLPPTRYELARYHQARVNIDYHIVLDRHYYSVPHALVGQQVELRATAATVEILHRGRRVAAHVRSHAAHQYTTVPEHMPAAHRAHLQWSPQRLIGWGGTIGPACAELVRQILHTRKHPEQGYRACLGLLRLGRDHGAQRLEAACARALTLGALSYRAVDSILKRKIESLPLTAAAPWSAPEHEH